MLNSHETIRYWVMITALARIQNYTDLLNE
jgi:hypothetical protein